MNEEKGTEAVLPLAVRIGTAQRAALALGRDLLPQGSVQALIHLGRALAQRAREGAEVRERSALATLLATCALADEALAYNAAIEAPAVRARRDAVVVQATTIKATLARWAAGDTPVAKAAADVQRALFPATENFAKLDQRTLWQVLVAKAQQLAGDDALAAALVVFVPEAATAALFAANDALGALLPRALAEAVKPVELAAVMVALQTRTQRYAAAVIAATDPDDAEAVRRADLALQPLAELRAARSGRRRQLEQAKARAVAKAAKAPQPPTAPEPVAEPTTPEPH